MNNNENKDEQIEILDSNKDDLEIIEFDDKKEKIVNTLEEKKENRIMFIIIGIVILFVLLLPTITSLFKTTSQARYSSNIDEIENNKTVDGMLEIGNEGGSITAKKIQFYEFIKRTGNTIAFSYLPETNIEKGSINDLYIELYNSRKGIIYRQNFEITEKLERKMLKTYKMQLNENIYSEAAYAKIVILENKDFIKLDNVLTCTITNEDDNKTVESKVIYNISENGLISYKVNRNATLKEKVDNNIYDENDEAPLITEEEANRINNATNQTTESVSVFENEVDSLLDYDLKDLEYDDLYISYSIDLVNNPIKNPLYQLGAANRQIKLYSESAGWKCSNE